MYAVMYDDVMHDVIYNDVMYDDVISDVLTSHWLGPQPYNRYVTISRITNSITIQMRYLIPYLLAWNRTVSSRSACPNKVL